MKTLDGTDKTTLVPACGGGAAGSWHAAGGLRHARAPASRAPRLRGCMTSIPLAGGE